MELTEADGEAVAETVIGVTRAAIGTQWSGMTVVAGRVEIIIEVVGELAPDLDRLTMTDTIDQVAEAVEMTMIGHETVVHVVIGTAVESELQAPRGRPNPQPRNPQRMSEIGVRSSSSSLPQG